MSVNDLSFNEFRVLRVKTIGEGDDNDWAGGQSLPTSSDLVELRRPGTARTDEPVRLKVEIVLEWLDESYDPVLTNRGSYNVEAIRVIDRHGTSGQVLCDSALLKGQMAYRPVVIDDLMAGDTFTARLTSMSQPTGALYARVLYREIF